jgi:hypothetical protein
LDETGESLTAEPWFLAFDADFELIPAMNLEDLKKATPGIEKAGPELLPRGAGKNGLT